VVVDKNLAGWMVTIHMILALVIVGIVMLAVFRNDTLSKPIKEQSILKNLSFIALVLTLIQIVSGTQVREIVDQSLHLGIPESWVERAGSILSSHIILSLLLGVISLLYWFQAKQSLKSEPTLNNVLLATLAITGLQLLSGIANRYLNFPAIAQVGHILFGTLVAGGWFYLYMVLNRKSAIAEKPAID
jgi:cytochrome c oxidase assembly protein subunit 15